jgi:deoxyribonuclease-4
MWKARELKQEEINLFREKLKASGMGVNGHMPYLPNLATPNDDMYKKSVGVLVEELGRCKALELPYLVTHMGSHLGSGVESGIKRIQAALNTALVGDECVMVLLENSAGGTNSVGSSFEEIGRILDGLKYGDRVGICFDTCHAFATGHDLRSSEAVESVLSGLEAHVGLDNVKLVHLNDSMSALGSGFDRHEHIGLGEIGVDGFRAILSSRFCRIPMVMETPVDNRRGDEGNLAAIRELAASL